MVAKACFVTASGAEDTVGAGGVVAVDPPEDGVVTCTATGTVSPPPPPQATQAKASDEAQSVRM